MVNRRQCGRGSKRRIKKKSNPNLRVLPLIISRDISQSIANLGRQARNLSEAVINYAPPRGKWPVFQTGDLVPEGYLFIYPRGVPPRV